MPELPEVETIRRDLEKEAVGKKIKSVVVTGKRTVRRHPTPEDFIERLESRKISGVSRKGKYLLIKLENKEVLIAHLGMSGQLLRIKNPKESLDKHTHVVITFTQGGQLRFVDPRTFGEMFVTTEEGINDDVPELAQLGFDPLDTIMSWTDFGRMIIAKHAKLKPLLMDQHFIAGIGNMYADEILFAAGLRHDRNSDGLTSQEIRRLYRSMVETLAEATKHRGSSLADEQYKDIFGEVGDAQTLHKVYDREGEACRRCRSPIVREKIQGRSTYFCDQCQV